MSTRTLERWDAVPGLEFPRAVYISQRRYRSLEALDQWDHDNARRVADPHSPHRDCAQALPRASAGASPSLSRFAEQPPRRDRRQYKSPNCRQQNDGAPIHWKGEARPSTAGGNSMTNTASETVIKWRGSQTKLGRRTHWLNPFALRSNARGFFVSLAGGERHGQVPAKLSTRPSPHCAALTRS